MHLDATRRREHLAALRERDHAELLEMMQKFLKDMSELKASLSTRSADEVQSVMRTLEEVFFYMSSVGDWFPGAQTLFGQELHDAALETTEERQLQRGLLELQRMNNSLSPMADRESL